MGGRLIIIEAGDGSGKATQARMLTGRLQAEGQRARQVSFPNYKSPAAALIKMYLQGDFGQNPGDVNAYAASTFYAVDRYASYRQDWGAFYRQGGVVVADRYTTSNMVHQAAKFAGAAERDKFLDWLLDLEFVRFELPRPTAVIFLNMPPEVALQLLKERDNKATGRAERDIHEADREFLASSYRNACLLAEKYGWHTVDCCRAGRLRPAPDIHQEIYALVKEYL
jgi:dTMP kinase